MKEICFDFETESLGLRTARPWQLAFTVAENGRVIDKFDFLIDVPGLKISKEVQRITRFDWDIYNSKKKPAAVVFQKFEKYLYDEDCRLIGHNILGYDVYIISVLAELLGKKIHYTDFIYRCVDTLALARAQHFQSKPPTDEKDFLAWQYKYLHKRDKAVKGSLAAVAKRNDIAVDETKTHDALYDVEINYQIYLKLKYALELP